MTDEYKRRVEERKSKINREIKIILNQDDQNDNEANNRKEREVEREEEISSRKKMKTLEEEAEDDETTKIICMHAKFIKQDFFSFIFFFSSNL